MNMMSKTACIVEIKDLICNISEDKVSGAFLCKTHPCHCVVGSCHGVAKMF